MTNVNKFLARVVSSSSSFFFCRFRYLFFPYIFTSHYVIKDCSIRYHMLVLPEQKWLVREKQQKDTKVGEENKKKTMELYWRQDSKGQIPLDRIPIADWTAYEFILRIYLMYFQILTINICKRESDIVRLIYVVDARFDGVVNDTRMTNHLNRSRHSFTIMLHLCGGGRYRSRRDAKKLFRKTNDRTKNRRKKELA